MVKTNASVQEIWGKNKTKRNETVCIPEKERIKEVMIVSGESFNVAPALE